jgi:hypothetical protein
MKDQDTRHAETLGRKAFENGLDAAPATDKDYMELIKGREVGNPQTILEAKAWHKGYQTANLAAPVE